MLLLPILNQPTSSAMTKRMFGLPGVDVAILVTLSLCLAM